MSRPAKRKSLTRRFSNWRPAEPVCGPKLKIAAYEAEYRGNFHASQPTMQPIIRMTCTYLEGLTQPSATCKLLNV